MSVNSSSSSNASHPPSHLRPSINLYSVLNSCYTTTAGTFTITAFTIAILLILLPVCISVLYLGVQRRRQQRSDTRMSHSDVLTYHTVVAELMGIIGNVLNCCGIHTRLPHMTMVGLYLIIVNFVGQMNFHLLTCVERYVAVVHPVTYLSLRKKNGVTIRNITIGCVWLWGLVGTGLIFVEGYSLIAILHTCFVVLTFIAVSFCSLSVLCVLIRPKPGGEGAFRQRVDQTKLRAFYTIMAILGVLLSRLCGYIISALLYNSHALGETEKCAVRVSLMWFYLPSSLVSPLLFLHRSGKLPCCKSNNQSGQGSD